MQVSHSRVECFEQCQFRYKLKYIDKLTTVKNTDADNALYLGTALHTGLEKNVNEAIQEYYMQFPVITDDQVNEVIKLEILINKAKRMIPDGINEVKIEDDDFIGYIDLLAPVKSDTRLNGEYQMIPNRYDLYDFKYSNNTSHYADSVQIHLYKYYFEKLNPGKKIRNLYYFCIPKVRSKQKRTESLVTFRKRIQKECMNAEPKLIEVKYDASKVIDWMISVKHMEEADDFPKNQTWSCRYCEFGDYCQKGWKYMLLPKNERRNIEKVQKKTIWLYGAPFSGKTTFANQFPDPLMLNTDGNIKFVDAPYIHIGDKVETVGRMTKRTLGWQIFKDVIDELEKKENSFKTIVVDLLEDTYEMCRLYMYDQMGITHESDDSFRAWDKVRTEFLSNIRRLMNLDYENIILISHEDTTKDVTKKTGDKITAIKPNIQEKTANKVAGMVDIVARIVADDNDRVLSFKANEMVFGGGRLLTKIDEIPLNYEKFCEVYQEANEAAAASMHHKADVKKEVSKESAPEDVKEAPEQKEEVKKEADSADDFMNIPEDTGDTVSFDDVAPKAEDVSADDEAPAEDKPKVRHRKRRTAE